MGVAERARQTDRSEQLAGRRLVDRRRRGRPAVQETAEVLGREDLDRVVERERRPERVRADRRLAAKRAAEEPGRDRGLEHARMPRRPQQDAVGVADDDEVPGLGRRRTEGAAHERHDCRQRVGGEPGRRLGLVEDPRRRTVDVDSGRDAALPRAYDHRAEHGRGTATAEHDLVRTAQQACPSDAVRGQVHCGPGTVHGLRPGQIYTPPPAPGARCPRCDLRRGREARRPVAGAGGFGEDRPQRAERTAMTNRATEAYTVASREDAIDFMADYPEYGEQRWYTSAIAADQVSFSWRRMRPRTGGRESYGHRHPGQEEVYFVISGIVTFKIDDDVFQARPQTGVRVAGDASRSAHNDPDDEAELLIFSPRLDEPPTEKQDDFWPSGSG